MSDPPLGLGKLPAALLAALLGDARRDDASVLLGPRVGEDACAIRLGEGTLVAATDPITMTGAGVGAHAVAVNANDVAVMGATPRWFLAVVLLPPGTNRSDVEALFAGMTRALDALGAVLVGGHTEVTEAVRQPVVTGQMLGWLEPGQRHVATGGVRPGDVVLQVGPAPIEGAAVAAAELRDRLATVDEADIVAAERALEAPGLSVVAPALTCARLGAHALHDPTEGGLSAGLHELAEASDVALRVEEEAILWFPPALRIARALAADPWGLLASGTLLAAFAPDQAEAAIQALEAEGHEARKIARAEPGQSVTLTTGTPLPRFERDELSRILES